MADEDSVRAFATLAVLYALAAPAHARMDEITVHPTQQGVVY